MNGKRMMAHESMQLAERTTKEFCNTLKRGGVDSCGIKVAQGYTWTGYYDTGPAWDVESFDAMMQIKAAFEAESIAFTPWCAPMGLQTDKNTPYYDGATAAAEVAFYAKIANAVGYLDMDIEPYGEFNPPLSLGDYRWALPFFSGLRAAAPDAHLVLDVPNRDVTWEGGKIGPLISIASPYIDAVHVQAYFGLADMKSQMQRASAHTDKPVLAIVGATPNFKSQLDYLDEQDVEGISVWVAQTMNSGYYAELAAHDFNSSMPPDTSPYQWQEPGFSLLFSQLGPTKMGKPTSLPYADNYGNVFQDSTKGFAMWRHDYNANFWNAK